MCSKGIYMAGAIEKLTLYTPVMASSGVFAIRRAGRGIDAMDDNPFFGVANIIIAGGQTLKGVRAAKDLAFGQTQSAAESIKAAAGTAKELNASNKFLKYTGKVFDYTSKHINPLICCASTIKVLGADDKEDAALREGLSLLGMFGSEAVGKSLLNMPKNVVNADGTVKTVPREVAKDNNRIIEKHVKTFVDKQTKALEDYCKTKKVLEKVPMKSLKGAAKGLSFVFLFSVPGYKIGGKIADGILGKEGSKNSEQRCQYVQINDTPEQASVSAQAA